MIRFFYLNAVLIWEFIRAKTRKTEEHMAIGMGILGRRDNCCESQDILHYTAGFVLSITSYMPSTRDEPSISLDIVK